MRKSLCVETSQVFIPGPIRIFRPALPSEPIVLGTNAARLNHAAGIGLLGYGLIPVAVGRSYPLPLPERSEPPTVGLIGNPLCRVTIEPSCQPPITALATPFVIFILRPFPTGMSHRPEATKRCL